MTFYACKGWISVWLIALAVATNAIHAQTIELKSARVSLLAGAERTRFLAAHNAARKAVNVDSVIWSDALSQDAVDVLAKQKDALIDAAKEGWTKAQVVLPAHRTEPKYGENIAGWIGRPGQSAEWAVNLWLREKIGFDKLNNSPAAYRVGDEAGKTDVDSKGQERPLIVGHYTAIVWHDTKEIGAAKLEFELVDNKGKTRHYSVVVCNYDPPGNIRGEKPY